MSKFFFFLFMLTSKSNSYLTGDYRHAVDDLAFKEEMCLPGSKNQEEFKSKFGFDIKVINDTNEGKAMRDLYDKEESLIITLFYEGQRREFRPTEEKTGIVSFNLSSIGCGTHYLCLGLNMMPKVIFPKIVWDIAKPLLIGSMLSCFSLASFHIIARYSDRSLIYILFSWIYFVSFRTIIFISFDLNDQLKLPSWY